LQIFDTAEQIQQHTKPSPVDAQIVPQTDNTSQAQNDGRLKKWLGLCVNRIDES
jgi:hypothetical protein